MRAKRRAVQASEQDPTSAVDQRHYCVFQYVVGEDAEKRRRAIQIQGILSLLERGEILISQERIPTLENRRLSTEPLLTKEQRALPRLPLKRLNHDYLVVVSRYILQMDSLVTIEECAAEDAAPVRITAGNQKLRCPWCEPLFTGKDSMVDPKKCFRESLPLLAANCLPMSHATQKGAPRVFTTEPRVCGQTGNLFLVQSICMTDEDISGTYRCRHCNSFRVNRHLNYDESIDLICEDCEQKTPYASPYASPYESPQDVGEKMKAGCLPRLPHERPYFDLIDFYRPACSRKLEGFKYVA